LFPSACLLAVVVIGVAAGQVSLLFGGEGRRPKELAADTTEANVAEGNKSNLLYFEASTMRGLHGLLSQWQEAHQKRLLSVSIERDGDVFCCVALTNPTEVVITNVHGTAYVGINDGDKLRVDAY
jgi:hypothetical protein